MPRTVVALWVVLSLGLGAGSIAGVAQAGTAKPKTTKKAVTKVRCHMVKATKKTKRHKVCVKVKSTTTSAKKAPAPRAAPSVTAPASGAPALGSPLVTSSPSVPTTPAVPAAVTAPVVAPPATDLPAAPAAARLQATTREFSIQLSRPTVAAGALILQLVNRGEDPHDLHVRPAAGGGDVLSVGLTDPFGGVSDTNGTLPAATYTLYCSLPGHEAAGMHATLSAQ